jgi:methylmalonyl-CoA mutase cobalamin-binding domain/chain
MQPSAMQPGAMKPGAMKPGAMLLDAGRRAAADLPERRSLFCQANDATSEVDFKRRAKANGTIMYHAHIGLADWAATEQALTEMQSALSERGHALHRYGLCVSRAMGMPPERRAGFPKETGPMLEADDWSRVVEAVPVHPHMGDNMIGTPNGFAGTLAALAVGATTIGNLGQYFGFEWPGIDDVELTEATVRALGAMSAWRDRGALMHSYLDDGAAMQLPHYGAYIGWAALELHAVETLCGVRLAHSFGGLVDQPLHRAVVALALDDIRGRGTSIGTMIYGNTVDMVRGNIERNRAVVATSAQVDIATQLHRPTGHAIHVTPLTEAERIPSAAENIEVQLFAREIEREARRSGDLYDWARLDRLAADCAVYALSYRDRALRLLADSGVHVDDPAALLLGLRQLGPAELDRRINLLPPADVGRLEPWKAGLMTAFVERVGRSLPRLDGRRVVLAVLEVHDVVRDALASALPRAGCEVVLLPADSTPAGVARAAVDEDADAVVVGVYNGSALTIANALRRHLTEESWEGTVVFGGLLNEDEGGDLPVDARDRIEALGIRTVHQIEELGALLAD